MLSIIVRLVKLCEVIGKQFLSIPLGIYECLDDTLRSLGVGFEVGNRISAPLFKANVRVLLPYLDKRLIDNLAHAVWFICGGTNLTHTALLALEYLLECALGQSLLFLAILIFGVLDDGYFHR